MNKFTYYLHIQVESRLNCYFWRFPISEINEYGVYSVETFARPSGPSGYRMGWVPPGILRVAITRDTQLRYYKGVSGKRGIGLSVG